jgi:intraflagellar transport protein 81
VYDVFLHIIPNAAPVDVSCEADPTSKLMEYLKAVKYKPTQDAGTFRLALANGARDIVYALLKWLLSQVPVLQRRATIGIYLTMPEVPPEFRGIQVS